MILEAMKMENVLKSTGEGTITSIEVEQGQSVEKNNILIKF
jgi:biotin carboxyl carrier protein